MKGASSSVVVWVNFIGYTLGRIDSISSRTAVVQRPISLLTNTDMEREDHLRLLDPESTTLLRNVG